MAADLSQANAPDAAQLAASTRRRIALRLLPFLFALYITNYLDRSSLAYAALGMSRDLGFSDRVFGLGAGVFFISYVALQMPGALLVERWSARRLISTTMIAWGTLTGLTALVQTPAQLYLARFVLGAAEGAFFPGVIVYLSHWFSREDRAKATSNFMAAIPISLMIGSPIAGWMLGRSWLDMAGWRWLFILEGLPSVVLGVVAFFFLQDSPGDATWLSKGQRQWIEGTLREEKLGGAQAMSIQQALRSRAIVLLASAAFLSYFALYAFVFWLPTLLKRMSGFSDMHVGLLGALPYLATFVAMQLNGWHSDKYHERRWHAALPVLIAAAGFFSLLAQPSSIGITLLLFTMVSVGTANLPAFWAIPTEILSQSAAAASVGMINAVASIAGFGGPYLFGYLNTRTGSFTCGLAVMGIAALAGGFLMLRVPKSA